MINEINEDNQNIEYEYNIKNNFDNYNDLKSENNNIYNNEINNIEVPNDNYEIPKDIGKYDGVTRKTIKVKKLPKLKL